MAQKSKPTLKRATLREFFEAQGHGAQNRMSEATGLKKSSISNIASGRHFASYAVAKRIRAHMEAHGFTIDLETMVRTEGAKP